MPEQLKLPKRTVLQDLLECLKGTMAHCDSTQSHRFVPIYIIDKVPLRAGYLDYMVSIGAYTWTMLLKQISNNSKMHFVAI